MLRNQLSVPNGDEQLGEVIQHPNLAHEVCGQVNWTDAPALLTELPGAAYLVHKPNDSHDTVYLHLRTVNSNTGSPMEAHVVTFEDVPVNPPVRAEEGGAWVVTRRHLDDADEALVRVCAFVHAFIDSEGYICMTGGITFKNRRMATWHFFHPIVTHRQSKKQKQQTDAGHSPYPVYRALIDKCYADITEEVDKVKAGIERPFSPRWTGPQGTIARPSSSARHISRAARLLMGVGGEIASDGYTVSEFYDNLWRIVEHFDREDMGKLFLRTSMQRLQRTCWHTYVSKVCPTGRLDRVVDCALEQAFRRYPTQGVLRKLLCSLGKEHGIESLMHGGSKITAIDVESNEKVEPVRVKKEPGL